jgi:Lar family restriction alleviation protein
MTDTRCSPGTSALLPCPFCGGKEISIHNHRKEMYWASCKSCGLEAPSETGVTGDDAVAYWNARAGAAQTQQEPVAWLDKRSEPAADWTKRIVATNPEYVEANGSHNFTPLYALAQTALRAAAERVCWFDWSDNDMDAVAAMDALRAALVSLQHQGGK